MGALPVMDQSLEGAAHVVQLALTPIFLLTGVGQLLNIFTTRLGRVADRVREIGKAGAAGRGRELASLRLRSRVLDLAVLLATGAGVLTCCTALALFTGAVRNEAAASTLFWLFGAALALTVVALGAFAVETILSTRTVREKVDEAAACAAAAGMPGEL